MQDHIESLETPADIRTLYHSVTFDSTQSFHVSLAFRPNRGFLESPFGWWRSIANRTRDDVPIRVRLSEQNPTHAILVLT